MGPRMAPWWQGGLCQMAGTVVQGAPGGESHVFGFQGYESAWWQAFMGSCRGR